MLGIILPTRGLIHGSAVAAAFQVKELLPDSRVYVSTGLNIPACFNVPIKRALFEGCDKVLIIEEDMGISLSALDTLLWESESHPVVALDYSLGNTMCAYRSDGIQFAGMGAMVIDAKVINELGAFRTDTVYQIPGLTESKRVGEGYGGQDVDFCIRAHRAGYPVFVPEHVKAQHFRVRELGKPETNKGAHRIEEI